MQTLTRHCIGRNGRILIAAVLVLSATGCAFGPKKQPGDLQYNDDVTGVSHYRERSTSIEYPCIDSPTDSVVAESQEPRNLLRRVQDPAREVSLQELVTHALSHNAVIETSALGGVGSKAVLQNPLGTTSVYDPAIQESGILFGRRGLEAALSDFDAQVSSSLTWGRSRTMNAATVFTGASNFESAVFTSALSKQFANGGAVSLSHDVTYSGSSLAADPFESSYSGGFGLSYRQPLLQGGGVEYTRIAGPARPGFGAITGVSQGVVIARINQDITLADFEQTVSSAVRDIEFAYWDLYFAYRGFRTATVAYRSAFQTWREARDRMEVELLKPADELQALDRLYETKAGVETALNQLFRAEAELRRLCGMPLNDGTVLRPADLPMDVEYRPDWNSSLSEALTHRVELRRQKWSIKSLQLQLQAARSLVRPRLDLVTAADVNGFGDDLIGSGGGIDNLYGSTVGGDLTSWNVGMEFSMPVGFRLQRAQVRNYELQVARASAILASQERNIAHDVSVALQDLTAAWAALQSNRKRMEAAAERVRLLDIEREYNQITLDLVLRAQASLATAENAYYQQLVSYNKAFTSLQFATGTLLRERSIQLAEGDWNGAARQDALLRAHARTHAEPNPYVHTEPAEFVSPGPIGPALPRTAGAVPAGTEQNRSAQAGAAADSSEGTHSAVEGGSGEAPADPGVVPAEPGSLLSDPAAVPGPDQPSGGI